jgi:hypothetical protein
MLHAATMRRCLIDLDVPGIRALWSAVSPHLPQPSSDADALTALHVARTQAESVPFRLRAYSHRWLSERALPSRLPDRLKPSAERLYPRVVEGVGISVNSKYPEVVRGVRGAMEYVVSDCYANGDMAPEIVKPLMQEARRKEQIALGTRPKWNTLVPVAK